VVAGSYVVVFEAKLHSPFSHYQNPADRHGRQLHQLAVQYAAVKDWSAGRRLSIPIMVAVTADVARPAAAIQEAQQDIQRLTGDDGQTVRWLPWHRIAAVLEGQKNLRPHEARHRQDLMSLMDRRGVRKVFQPIPMEDYWLMTAAQRVAVHRLYPQIRTFFDELTSLLDQDDIGWSQASYKGMWLGGRRRRSPSRPTGLEVLSARSIGLATGQPDREPAAFSASTQPSTFSNPPSM
jgi:hypothetical protein